eukprot:g10187.t1
MPAADSEPKPRPRDKRKKAAPDAQNQESCSALQAPLVPDWKRKANEEKAQKQAEQEASMLRVLALHGGGQCGESLKSKMKHLMKGKLKGEVEFHFLDAPFLTRFPHVDPETGEHSYGDEEDKRLSEKVRSWWGWNSWDLGDTRYAIHGHDQDGMIYQGIAESLRAVLAEWTKMKNGTRGVDAAPYYHGIFGFSQGAIVASLFAEMLAQMQQDGDDLLDTAAISSTPRSSAKTFFRENVLPKSGNAAADAAGDITAATCDQICRLDQPQFLVLVSGFLKPVPINLQWYWRGSQEEEESDKDDPPSSVFDANTPLEDIATELSAENRLGVEGRSVGDGDKNSFVRCRKRFAGAATPTLHLYGENDTVMPNCRSDQLAARFLEPTIVVHKQKLGHDVPQPTDADALAKVQEFILEQKKRIMGRLGK